MKPARSATDGGHAMSAHFDLGRLVRASAICAALVGVAVPVFVAGPAFATSSSNPSYTVNSTADDSDANAGDGICATSDGVCTIRAALEEAENDGIGGGTVTGVDITVPAGTYQTDGSLGMVGGVALHGAGAATTDIQQLSTSANTEIFRLSSPGSGATSLIEGVTVENGKADAIYDNGLLTLRNSVVKNNAQWGAEDVNQGLTVSGSTFTGNGTSNNSGGLYIESNATVSNSTFYGNAGNGIYVDSGPASITETTIAANSQEGLVTFDNPTVSATVVAAGSGSVACSGSGHVISSGHNMDSDGTCALTDPTDQSSVAPQFGTFGNNGGSTPTLALTPSSPAVDSAGSCTGVDQRGVVRPQDGNGDGTARCDIGAFELGGPATHWTVVPSQSGGVSSQLTGVAAFTSSDAWAVGSFTDSGGTLAPLAEHWDGSAWHIVVPLRGGTGSSFAGVAGTSGADVWAVGSYKDALGTVLPFAEHWNGTAWSVSVPPKGGVTSTLTAVTAISSGDVWAVGSFTNALGTVAPLAEHWNGSAWSVTTPPRGGTGSTLTGVTASASNDVLAVGSYTDSASKTWPLSEHWNGSAWSLSTPPKPGITGSLSAVGTVAAGNMWAVGAYQDAGNTQRALGDQWNGTSWAVHAASAPQPTAFNGVAAVAATDVWAVGTYQAGGGVTWPRAAHWTGSVWALADPPHGGKSSSLAAAAATSALDVWAVGSFTDSSNVAHPFIERYTTA